MASIRRAPEVRGDLKRLWDYIADNSSESRATNFLKKLERQIIKLSESPGMGRKRDELRLGLYSFPVKPYLIFYTIEAPQEITVRRVIHGKRDIEKQFSNE